MSIHHQKRSGNARGVDPAYERIYGKYNSERVKAPESIHREGVREPAAPVKSATQTGARGVQSLSVQDLIAATRGSKTLLASAIPSANETDRQNDTTESKSTVAGTSGSLRARSRWENDDDDALDSSKTVQHTTSAVVVAAAPKRRTLDEDNPFIAPPSLPVPTETPEPVSGTKRSRTDSDDEGELRNQARRMNDSKRARYTTPTELLQRALLHGCRSVNAYRPLEMIDEGTYGVVFSAEDIETGEKVALKKVKMDMLSSNDGFPITALRETNILLMLRHPNIVSVKEMVVGSDIDKVYMVMEFMDHGVQALMQHMTEFFTQGELKCLMLQLLSGIAYMHDRWIIHRDLKTSNLLMDNAGRLCICDFGLARKYSEPVGVYTTEIVTQWYRAPELLLGAKKYSTEIDMWSAGCIFSELITKKPLFPGTSEADQLSRIFRLLGTPHEGNWPGWESLPNAKLFFGRFHEKQKYRHALSLGVAPFGGAPYVSDLGLDLLESLLTYDPKRRITAQQALEHPWFEESPPPTDPRLMPSFPPRKR